MEQAAFSQRPPWHVTITAIVALSSGRAGSLLGCEASKFNSHILWNCKTKYDWVSIEMFLYQHRYKTESKCKNSHKNLKCSWKLASYWLRMRMSEELIKEDVDKISKSDSTFYCQCLKALDRLSLDLQCKFKKKVSLNVMFPVCVYQVPGPWAAVLISGLPTHSMWLYPWSGAQAAAFLSQLHWDHAQRCWRCQAGDSGMPAPV